MMKKILALVLCLLMLGTCALAESTRVEFGETFYLMRPDDLEVVELGEEEASEDMVYAATNDELEMYVWAYDMEELTAQELYEMWQEDDYLTDIQTMTLGDGATYLTYEIIDEGLGAVFACGDGKYYDFIFYCQTDEALAEAQGILQSVAAI